MIVRQTKQIPQSYVYGVGGGVAFLFVAIFAARSMLMVTTVVPSCEERYMTGVRFSFARQNGEALSSADLQGKLAGLDWGLIENVQMRKLKDGPAPVVLEVDLKTPHVAGSEAIDTGRSGMGFVWQPKALPTANAGCLAYSVWVPADFTFGRGGTLPGLFGEEAVVAATETTEERKVKAFGMRLHWRGDGGLDVVPAAQDMDAGKQLPLTRPELRLERGRWVKIVQEAVLNTPGQDDGVLRVWVDGQLGFETGGVVFRGDASQKMNGVNVDLHFTDEKLKWAPATKSTKMRLSPLELRLQ